MKREPPLPITKVLRGALGHELVALGVATTLDLRARGWKDAFIALTRRHPGRRTTPTALSLAAAELGVRPSEVSESRLSRIEVFVQLQQAASCAAETGVSKAQALDAMNHHANRQARSLWIAAGRGTPIGQAVRPDVAADLVLLGVRTVADLRRRGWRRVFAELAAKAPRRRTKGTAKALYAADSGIRPSDVLAVPGAEAEIARACADED